MDKVSIVDRTSSGSGFLALTSEERGLYAISFIKMNPSYVVCGRIAETGCGGEGVKQCVLLHEAGPYSPTQDPILLEVPDGLGSCKPYHMPLCQVSRRVPDLLVLFFGNKACRGPGSIDKGIFDSDKSVVSPSAITEAKEIVYLSRGYITPQSLVRWPHVSAINQVLECFGLLETYRSVAINVECQVTVVGFLCLFVQIRCYLLEGFQSICLADGKKINVASHHIRIRKVNYKEKLQ
ncbi:hypothetical protein CEXT_545701 [Caerostris extrusa]|uniref:Uncharacterized protein n=1 Tax=Caerostris extrusa TaxID=172846 RepID=A0AAV4NMG6_CAEEX|nr:hypothetical protein CEXT_545701 [Caerostris extrusa]